MNQQSFFMDRGADISKCGRYRYTLWRCWDDALPTAVFVMLNPSTADANEDDPTIRKCIGFARRWGCGSILVVNMFAFRTPYPKDLAAADARGEDIYGPDRDEVLQNVMAKSKARGWPVICAWGSPSKGGQALRRLVSLNARAVSLGALVREMQLHCLGTAKDGNPRHPLMLPYVTERQPWP